MTTAWGHCAQAPRADIQRYVARMEDPPARDGCVVTIRPACSARSTSRYTDGMRRARVLATILGLRKPAAGSSARSWPRHDEWSEMRCYIGLDILTRRRLALTPAHRPEEVTPHRPECPSLWVGHRDASAQGTHLGLLPWQYGGEILRAG